MSRLTRKIKRPTLKNTYGTMILQKGLILYHTSTSKFDSRDKDSLIFFTFHPSEWSNFSNEVVTRIQLTKNMKLFFMVKGIRRLRVHSLLNTLTGNPNSNYKNLNKQYDVNLRCYLPYLRAENFDGWFSTVEGKTAVEVALINNPDYFTILETQRTKRTWIFDDDFKQNIRYPIYTQYIPIKLIIHSRYKDDIESYANEKHYFPFQAVLENAHIEYFDGPDAEILWNC